MKKNAIKLLLCCLILTLGWSCKKAPVCDCFMAAGKPSSVSRTVPAFNRIDVYDDVNVFLSVGPQQVIIDGGENLIPNITTDVSGGWLTLKNNNICDWTRSYKKSIINVYITAPDLSYIRSNGVGTVQSTDTITYDTVEFETKSAGDINLLVNTRHVFAHMFGASDLYIKGKTDDFECNFFAGTGFVYGDKLISGYTFISNSSIGDCYVNSMGGLDAVIYKNGNVYYSGNPTGIGSKTYGTGQLIKE